MAKIIHAWDCDCKTCKGTQSPGKGIIGGTICLCSCHNKRKKSNNMNKMLGGYDSMTGIIERCPICNKPTKPESKKLCICKTQNKNIELDDDAPNYEKDNHD